VRSEIFIPPTIKIFFRVRAINIYTFYSFDSHSDDMQYRKCHLHAFKLFFIGAGDGTREWKSWRDRRQAEDGRLSESSYSQLQNIAPF
jgi:hypothetical protein